MSCNLHTCHLILIDCSIFRNLQDVVFIIKKGLIHEYLQNMSKHKKLNQNYTEKRIDVIIFKKQMS